jgi:hypothetical protein
MLARVAKAIFDNNYSKIINLIIKMIKLKFKNTNGSASLKVSSFFFKKKKT